MNKITYEAPVTERFQVELEGVFCSSVFNEATTQGVIKASDHSVLKTDGTDYLDGWGDFNDQFSSAGWE